MAGRKSGEGAVAPAVGRVQDGDGHEDGAGLGAAGLGAAGLGAAGLGAELTPGPGLGTLGASA